MSFESPGRTSLEYFHCRYGKSRLMFRGPKRKLDRPYVAFFGGSETYGKFVETPFPNRVEAITGRRCVNFGCMNAGVGLFANDATLIDAACSAELTVIQLMGAHNMSNRFYAVHPRRNDRLVRASNLMKTVYREVDFTEFNFTRHMLSSLQRTCDQRFEMVVEELKVAWVARMRSLMEKIDGKIVLLWPRDRRMDSAVDLTEGLGADPLFVDSRMVDALRPKVKGVVEVDLGDDVWAAGTDGMTFSEMEAPAAREVPNAAAHALLAKSLTPMIQGRSA